MNIREELSTDIFAALGLEADFQVTNQQWYPSCFAVSDLAATSVAAVGAALVALIGEARAVVVDQRLASLWFGASLFPKGWALPPLWDAVAGDYPCQDGWIRLHTNLPHHRRAALELLKTEGTRDAVGEAVKNWSKDALETAIVANGGVAAAMRSAQEWRAHPQGCAVMAEPLIKWNGQNDRAPWAPSATRPLQGLKVLDMTRVLAGPVATRTLAGFGADVLRIDPPEWDEANVAPDITLGKRCARLDLTVAKDRDVFKLLLAEADIFIHGYRPGALAGLGFGSVERREISPNLLEVSLDAYGWAGPWARRRGFDSLVQMSCGIADTGMHWAGRDAPVPLPVQALDHATGYLMAAAAIRLVSGNGASSARLSLARVAALLMNVPQERVGALSKTPEAADYMATQEATPWGPALRLRPPLQVQGVPMHWERGACNLGQHTAKW